MTNCSASEWSQADYAKQALRDKHIEHKQYIVQYGEDMSEINRWKWTSRKDPSFPR
jgi:xylulose-5-phosphate/fructose-6-phosphate phosphoketolase